VTYERYDVDIDIQADGTLSVAETYQLRFEGEFQTGFAEIPLTNVSDIVDVQVWEGDQSYGDASSGPATFEVSREWDAMRVEWEYEPTSGTEVRTFTVTYRVLGGLWVYPEGDELSWTAVPEDRSGIPVEASRVTVRLPDPIAPDALEVAAPGATAELVDRQTIAFESQGPLPDGTPMAVTVRFPHGLTAATTPDWQRKIDEALASYRWTEFAVDLTIEPNGSLAVTERQTLAVDEGYLYHGYRVIPWLYLDGIAGLALHSDDRAFEYSTEPCEYCYVVEEEGGRDDWATFNGRQLIINEERVGSTLVEWAFPALEAGREATFELSYTVLGAVRVLTDSQEIAWTAVFADRDVPVEAASLNLFLPPGLGPEDVTVSGGSVALHADVGLTVSRDGPVPEGEAWSVTIRLPAGATTAAKSAWQSQLERQLERQQAAVEAEREQAVQRARWQVALGALGCLFPVLGLTGVITAWYAWGRDRAAPAVASYLTEPPSDLPPGIVAYLVDERPTVKGVLADLLHLATLGLISVDLKEEDFTVRLNWTRQIDEGEVVRVADGDEVELVEHERTLFNMLVERIKDLLKRDDKRGKGRPIPFSKIDTTFTRILPTIYEQMGEVASQYFSTLPETARRRWRWAGQRVVIVAGLLGLVGLLGMVAIGWPACAPPVGLAFVGLMLIGVSRWMPQRTTLGIEEAARWRAFRRYLKNLKQFGDLEAAQAVLDRYFPYAVALDVDEIVLRAAERMDAYVPIWMAPAPIDVGSAGPRAARRRPLLDRVTEGMGMPRPAAGTPRAVITRPSLSERPAGADLSLQGISDSLSWSLNQASRSLTSLLNTAVGDVDDTDSPFEVVVRGAGEATKLSWKAGTSTMKVLGDILQESSSGGGSGGFRGAGPRPSRRSGGFRSSSWSSSGSSFRGSGGSSGRSGGGGSRGFG
jgi:hypothetical protein